MEPKYKPSDNTNEVPIGDDGELLRDEIIKEAPKPHTDDSDPFANVHSSNPDLQPLVDLVGRLYYVLRPLARILEQNLLPAFLYLVGGAILLTALLQLFEEGFIPALIGLTLGIGMMIWATQLVRWGKKKRR